ncbi:recombinase family protein [Aestuariicoccus sp. MJ-SS9]|uniref:recombinase family protein n=1 Tax=Aestuariicoccus sp. MJ-SS9 TaxID=3079855 RepID=UPI00290EAC2C|nr:recombinase family protein [Aestuariicoccus sp. MJ-SS9]MDU8911990.1 recombinase family protein [Aestuariicoccus sp. MJ-SS9]
MTTVFYARVSTADQTVAHQVKQAEAAGFEIDCTIADEGVSGVSTRLKERPQGKRLFDKLREGDTLVVRWIDRLGRNYDDVKDVIQEFMQMGVTIRTVINGMTFDAKPRDPMHKAIRDALLSFMAALGEAQAEATAQARDAGIAHAKATAPQKYLGRKPSYSQEQLNQVIEQLSVGTGVSQIARDLNLNVNLVSRIKRDPAEAQAKLDRWSTKQVRKKRG